MKNESGSCAHLKVVHKRNQHEGGYWDSWECDLCGVRFSPVHPIDPPQGNNHMPASAYPARYEGQKPSWFNGQVPQETISSEAHQAWLKERQAQEPLNPRPITLGTCSAFAHKHALHAKTQFCEKWLGSAGGRTPQAENGFGKGDG